ncbi:MAG: sporulation protein YabP [Clostridia bacterium]|nr:sporulation protein YabP [Clostridia bacterium]
MEERRREDMIHNVTMEERRNMTVSGVEDVDSFDEDKIVAYTTEGVMTIKGAEMRINRLNVEKGEMEIEGEIDSIEYAEGHKSEKGSFFGKIFR